MDDNDFCEKNVAPYIRDREGSREIQKLIQADYALGYRVDKPRRFELPIYSK